MTSLGYTARVLLLVPILVAASSCGSDSSLPRVLSCDVSASECQADIYASLAPLLGADLTDVPSIRVISPEEFRQEVLDGATPFRLPTEGAEQHAYELMGFIPSPGRNGSEAQLELLVQGASAYYDSGVITIIDRDYEPGFVQFTLAHELVHAIQDRDFGLDNLADVQTTDELLARRSVPEGDADYFAHDWYYRAQNIELIPRDWGEINRERREALYELAADPESSAFDSANFFPYSQGLRLVSSVMNRDGFEGRQELFATPPSSSYDLMFSDFPNVSRFPLPIESQETEILPPEGYELVITDRLGAWFLYVYLRRLGIETGGGPDGGWSADNSYRVPLGGGVLGSVSPQRDWRGDRFSVYEKEGDVAVVWHLRHRDLEYSDYNVDLVSDLVNNSSAPGAWAARRTSENEVAVIVAEDEAALARWQSQPVVFAMEKATFEVKGLRGKTLPRPICVMRGR